MAVDTPALFRKKALLAALAAASVLFLSTACAPDVKFGQGAGGAGSGSSSGADGDVKDGKDGTGGKDADGKDGKDSASGTLTGKDCLPGNWLADNKVFEGFMNSVSGSVSVTTTGHVVLTLNPDGSTQTTYDHWNHNMKVNGGTSVVERHGIDKGTYSVSNGRMTMTDTSIGSVTTMTVNAGGQTITHAVEPEPSVFSQGTFTCSGDRLDVTVDGYTAVMHREH